MIGSKVQNDNVEIIWAWAVNWQPPNRQLSSLFSHLKPKDWNPLRSDWYEAEHTKGQKNMVDCEKENDNLIIWQNDNLILRQSSCTNIKLMHEKDTSKCSITHNFIHHLKVIIAALLYHHHQCIYKRRTKQRHLNPNGLWLSPPIRYSSSVTWVPELRIYISFDSYIVTSLHFKTHKVPMYGQIKQPVKEELLQKLTQKMKQRKLISLS